jgi:hypothetical protein
MLITNLQENQVFVFGSNTQGRHGKGAAKQAYGNYPPINGTVGKWAIYGTSKGLMKGCEGYSYAVITKELRRDKFPVTLDHIETQINELNYCAKYECPELEFLVTPFGTGLAMFTTEVIGKLWEQSELADNIILPECWSAYNENKELIS